MITKTPKKQEINRDWYLIDAKGEVLGRIATKIARLLIGKDKSNFSYSVDCGDLVVVINSNDVRVTGRKKKQKLYRRYSGYPGGLKETTFERLLEKDSRKIIEHAVRGMLPKNKLRSKRLKRLRVFKKEKHNFEDKKLNKI